MSQMGVGRGVLLQHVLHDEDDVVDELRVGVVDDDLPVLVEELLDDALDLVEEDGVEGGRDLVAHQLLDVLLDLGAKLLVGADQQLQQLTQEKRHRTILEVLA